MIRLTYPYAPVSSQSVLLKGRSDGSVAFITVSHPVYGSADHVAYIVEGDWTTNVVVYDGLNYIYLSNDVGDVSTTTIFGDFICPSTPSLWYSSTSTGTLFFQGVINESGAVTVSSTNGLTTIDTDKYGIFYGSVELYSGVNSIGFRSFDAAGNSSTESSISYSYNPWDDIIAVVSGVESSTLMDYNFFYGDTIRTFRLNSLSDHISSTTRKHTNMSSLIGKVAQQDHIEDVASSYSHYNEQIASFDISGDYLYRLNTMPILPWENPSLFGDNRICYVEVPPSGYRYGYLYLYLRPLTNKTRYVNIYYATYIYPSLPPTEFVDTYATFIWKHIVSRRITLDSGDDYERIKINIDPLVQDNPVSSFGYIYLKIVGSPENGSYIGVPSSTSTAMLPSDYGIRPFVVYHKEPKV